MLSSLIIGSCAIFISLIAGIIRYKKLEPEWLRLFVYFLALDFCVQIAGYAYSVVTRKSNHFIFNFLILSEFVFYFFILYKSLARKELKLFVKLIACTFILFAAWNLTWGESFHQFNQHTYTLGTLLVILCCLLYFAEAFMSEEVFNFFRVPMFWIATGLFFFYAGNGIYFTILDYIDRNNLDPEGRVYLKIMVVLNVLLYALFTIGFLCTSEWKKENL